MFDKGGLAILGAFALGITFLACSGSSASPPEQKVDVVSPTSGLKVKADIASVTLGDECAAGGGGFCQPSNLQMAFIADAGTKGAAFEIVKAELLDSSNGAVIDALTVTKPQIWNGSGYVTWDQNVTPGGDLKASYDLSSPQWSKIDGTQTGRVSSSYSKAYKLQLTIRIDGAEIVLVSTDLNRQPVAAT
jgi:hypothetical protein